MSLIPTTQVNVSPDDYKRKIAYALMQQGMDTSPVHAWTQGAARALQGAFGGYEMYRDEQKKKEDSAAEGNVLYNMAYPPQASPAAPPVEPAPPPAAMPPQPRPAAAALAKPVQMASADPAAITGPRPGGAVMPTNKVWGDAEAEAAGLYPPSKPNAAMALANPNAPMQPTPVQSVPVTPSALPASPVAEALAPKPDVVAQADPMQAKIDALRKGTPYEQSVAKALLSKKLEDSFAPKYEFKNAGDTMYRTNAKTGSAEPIKEIGRGVKPMTDEQRKQWKVPEGVAAGVDDNGKPVFSQPSAINSVSPVIAGVNDRFDAAIKAAQTSPQVISSIHEARRALDSGAITGAMADQKLFLAKVGTMFGLPNDAVANTEVARASLGNQVLESAKTLGANPSNADRDYIEKVKGGSIKLDESSMRRLLDMQEKWARDGVKRSNDMAEKMIATDPEKLGRFKPMMMVDEPPDYQTYIKNNPAKSEPPAGGVDPAALAEAKRRGLIR